MRALIMEPGKLARVENIKGDLEDLQKRVGGDIECVYPFDEMVGLICNEEGKNIELPLNRGLRYDGEIYDIIAGPLIIVGLTEDSFGDLSDSDLEKFEEMFRYPEIFSRVPGTGEIVGDKYDPVTGEIVEDKDKGRDIRR